MNEKKTARLLDAAVLVFSLSVVFALSCQAQTSTIETRASRLANREAMAEKNLAAARQNPLQLRHFLLGFPKGADLHYHLSGGVYAETFIKDAAEDGLWVNVKDRRFIRYPEEAPAGTECDEKWKKDEVVPAKAAFCDQSLYDALVDSFSMRGFVPYGSYTAHDHFFDSFGKFSGTKPVHRAEWVDEVASRAAAQNEQYLELMETPDCKKAEDIAGQVSWTEDFAKLWREFLARGVAENVSSSVAWFRSLEQKRREIERCSQSGEQPACKVEVKYIWQVLRGKPKEAVFAQALVAFEAAQAYPDGIVGINFVMPEDGYIARADYALHMRMVKFLHQAYPTVHISLHAGEITYGQVPTADLCCHIRLAVEAGAERIGHGVAVMYEDKPHELMREMASKHVMVEVNLSSNDLILGVSGRNHPLPLYRQFRVPVALSSDDEGVSRIDLTNEYVRAVATYDLHYADLKKMVRTGLEHAFMPGSSLWAERDGFARTVGACANEPLGGEHPSNRCAEFLRANQKARQQWELERRFQAFETNL
jgi:adenosine deaminase